MRGKMITLTVLLALSISTIVVGQPLRIDSMLIYGQVSTSRLQTIQDYLEVKDSLVALGNYPNAIRLHGRLFKKCFQLNEDISIIKGSLLIGEIFHSNGKRDLLRINPISKGVTILMQRNNYLPTNGFKKEWEDAVSFFHSNRIIIQ